jgi:hypothetical protein
MPWADPLDVGKVLVRQPLIFMKSAGSVFMWLNDDIPMPKSSSANLMPTVFRAFMAIRASEPTTWTPATRSQGHAESGRLSVLAGPATRLCLGCIASLGCAKITSGAPAWHCRTALAFCARLWLIDAASPYASPACATEL